MKKVLACCYGTRPEFIKIAPVALELKKKSLVKPVLVCSGQHRELLQGLDKVFGIKKIQDLNIRQEIGGTADLGILFSAMQREFYLCLLKLKPDGVLVQGDTASVVAGGMAAFHLKIPVFYLEAGLRTYDLENPYPEEGYRQMLSRIASVCFAPTLRAKENLLREGINPEKIFVVGNTVVDAVSLISSRRTPRLDSSTPLRSAQNDGGGKKTVLVEIHRRESWGETLREIFGAIKQLARKNKNYEFVFPVHPNKAVKNAAEEILGKQQGVKLMEPMGYLELLSVLAKSAMVITDSGGLQEEAPSFGVPVLVVRNKTERPEGVEKGWAVLAGVEKEGIISGFNKLKNWVIPLGGNPYGDGKAAERVAKIIYEKI